MKIQFLFEIFIAVCLINNVKTDLVRLRDELEKLNNADIKYHEVINEFDAQKNNNDYLFVINDKPVLRVRHKVGETKKDQILRAKHEERMNKIIEFMKNNVLATKYLFNEVQRIIKTNKVKDELRKIIWFLEKPENEYEKSAVLSFFYYIKRDEKKPRNVWDQKTNDLVINVIKDPINDGVDN